MGDLLDKLNASAKQAVQDNKKLEKEREEWVKTKQELEQSVKDLDKDKTVN